MEYPVGRFKIGEVGLLTIIIIITGIMGILLVVNFHLSLCNTTIIHEFNFHAAVTRL